MIPKKIQTRDQRDKNPKSFMLNQSSQHYVMPAWKIMKRKTKLRGIQIIATYISLNPRTQTVLYTNTHHFNTKIFQPIPLGIMNHIYPTHREWIILYGSSQHQNSNKLKKKKHKKWRSFPKKLPTVPSFSNSFLHVSKTTLLFTKNLCDCHL